MTAFTSSDIPAGIDTLEKLKAWVDLLTENLYGTETYQELQGAFLERRVDLSLVRTADKNTSMIARSSITIDPAYATSTSQKLWQFAQPLGTATIPAEWKTD